MLILNETDVALSSLVDDPDSATVAVPGTRVSNSSTRRRVLHCSPLLSRAYRPADRWAASATSTHGGPVATRGHS